MVANLSTVSETVHHRFNRVNLRGKKPIQIKQIFSFIFTKQKIISTDMPLLADCLHNLIVVCLSFGIQANLKIDLQGSSKIYPNYPSPRQ